MGQESESNANQTEGFSFLDFAVLVFENIRVLVVLPVVLGLAAFAITFAISPIYTSTARILPPTQQQNLSAALLSQFGNLGGLLGSAAGIKNPSDQYVAFLKSRTVFDAIIRRFHLKEVYNERYVEDVRKELGKRATISAGSKDGVITIDVEDEDPKRAAEIANAFVDELKALTNTLAVSEAAQRRLFFEQQLKQTKDQLTASEIALRQSGVSEATLKAMPQSALEAIARLKAQITAQEIKLASMRTFLTESSPAFKLALQELVALRGELFKAEQTNVGKAAGDGTEYIAKFRDFKYHETLFELMSKQYELARLDEAREGAVIQVVDVAHPPEKRTRPKRLLVTTLTFISASFCALIFVFMRQLWMQLSGDPDAARKLARLRQVLRIKSRL